jgi:hypothetical protein
MGFLDRLLGREPRELNDPGQRYQTSIPGPETPARSGIQGEDERAIARYRYLLRTAPPEELERVHAEAFSRLTPEQRSQVLAELSQNLPPGERVPAGDPQALARAATRAEMRQPGYLEQTFSRGRFGGVGGGMGMGGTLMGSMMGTIAGVVVGSAIADALFDDYNSSPEAAEAGDSSGVGDTGAGDQAGDAGSGDAQDGSGWSDTAGGSDVAGGNFGGGDIGGGDFGGDFGGGF